MTKISSQVRRVNHSCSGSQVFHGRVHNILKLLELTRNLSVLGIPVGQFLNLGGLVLGNMVVDIEDVAVKDDLVGEELITASGLGASELSKTSFGRRLRASEATHPK